MISSAQIYISANYKLNSTTNRCGSKLNDCLCRVQQKASSVARNPITSRGQVLIRKSRLSGPRISIRPAWWVETLIADGLSLLAF